MEFFKTVIKNRKLIFQLGNNDFRNRFASTSLGTVWGFIQPFIFMLTYVIVFQYILKTGAAGNDPFVVWYIPAMAMWLTLNDTIMNTSYSIRSYSYLVKKVVFPIDIIPMITIVSCAVVGLFLFAISVVVCMCFGYMPNVLMLLYMIIAAYAFIIAFTRFTSALCTIVPDFAQLLTIIMQLVFWFTPIIWNLNMLGEGILLKIFKCLPFTYLVTGFRQVFISGNIATDTYGIYSIVFWAITILIFLWGNSIFKRTRKDFADIL